MEITSTEFRYNVTRRSTRQVSTYMKIISDVDSREMSSQFNGDKYLQVPEICWKLGLIHIIPWKSKFLTICQASKYPKFISDADSRRYSSTIAWNLLYSFQSEFQFLSNHISKFHHIRSRISITPWVFFDNTRKTNWIKISEWSLIYLQTYDSVIFVEKNRLLLSWKSG